MMRKEDIRALRQPRIETVWTLRHALIIGLLGIVVGLAATVCMAALPSVPGLSGREVVALRTIGTNLAIIACIYLYLRFFASQLLVEFWTSVHWSPSASTEILCFLIGMIANTGIHFLLSRSLTIVGFVAPNEFRLVFLSILGTIVLESFTEEIYFRGILYEAIAQKAGTILSITMVTALFVVLHIRDPLHVLPLGILLGLARVITRSTCASFSLHCGYNFAAVGWWLLSAPNR
jgi:membrane protease YdiL (CAAX protease family)